MTILPDPVERYLSQYYFEKNVMGMGWDWNSFLEENRFHNFIVKKLTGQNNLKQAKNIIDDFFFVGFVEEFDRSLILLRNELDTSFNINYQKRRVNSAKKYDKYADGLTTEQLDAVKKNNKLDIELYNCAYNKFEEELNKIPKLDELEMEFENKNQSYEFPKWKKKIFKIYRKVYYRHIEKVINRIYHGPPTK